MAESEQTFLLPTSVILLFVMHRLMYMAQTSMHTDPHTGEILNASVYIHHNFLSLLYSGRCTQTMASDPTARTLTLSEKQMGELLKVGIAQQVGRCLGLYR